MIRDLDFSLSPLPCCLLFVASSLSPHLARFLACLGTLRSASYQLPSFSLQRFGGPNCGSSHQWSGIDGKRSCCWFVRMIFVERASKFSKVLDR